MLWLWLYLGVAAVIAGGGLWVTRDVMGIGGGRVVATEIAIGIVLALGWLPFLIGALVAFVIFVTAPHLIPAFRNQAGG